MKTLVALDLETTGLDPTRDAILEIGVVRFRGQRVEAEWHSLVNPGRPIPAFITQLTGITDDMVAEAPRLQEILPELRDFVGDAPILGHNIQFDLDFLGHHDLFRLNQMLDTYDLASVLLPSAARYSLVGLAAALGVPVRESHRALDDAHTTRQVFLRLVDQAMALPLDIVEEIVRLGANVEWGAGWIFEEVYQARLEAGEKPPARPTPLRPRVDLSGLEAEPLEPVPNPRSLDIEELAAILEPGGPLAASIAEYEHRPQQVTMLRAVAQALSESRHLLVEAGTGTGKSLAYLIPAFAWAAQNGHRVVISTNTINLQDQLIHKDIPDLAQALGWPLRAAVLKGRANYLCPRRLDALRRLGPRSADEMRVLAKVLVWLAQGGTGDRSELNLRGAGEAIAWSRICSDSQDCNADRCLHAPGGPCPYYAARLLAERAHIVIVNHALLLADVATGSRVLPEYDYLIVDEAHHLESATTSGLSFRVGQADVHRLLRDLDGDGGLLGQIIAVARRELPANLASQVQEAVGGLRARVRDCRKDTDRFFEALAGFLQRQREDRPVGPYGQQVRIVPGTRTLPAWSEVEVAWDRLREPLAEVVNELERLSEELAAAGERGLAGAEDLAVGVRAVGRGLAEVFDHLEHIVFDPDPNTIYWAEVRSGNGLVSLHAAPLEVGPLVERHLWHAKESVIMTSATLTTAGEFDYIRRRLNAYDADELALGSPFDYEGSTLLYLVNDIPEPAQGTAYQRALEQGLIRLCAATGGRTLVLFTSHAQLRRTARAIAPPLARQGIVVLEQSEGASRHALLETFRTTDQAVLLGTRSFWEGVDVPGPALSVLAIAKLPFDVPSDPIIAARAETYEAPFQQYTVPEAILRFRQGFGRLIRTASDRGVVVVFDRRVLSKTYGPAFIQSLPRCTLRQGPLAELPVAAARWLGL